LDTPPYMKDVFCSTLRAKLVNKIPACSDIVQQSVQIDSHILGGSSYSW